MSKQTLETSQYWTERAELNILATEKTAREMLKDLEQTYNATTRAVQREIESFYGRYSRETGMSYEDVTRRLSRSELQTAQADLQRYHAEVERLGGYSPRYRAYLRELSAKSYMSRLEEFQMQMRHELENLYRAENMKFGNSLRTAYTDSFYRGRFDLEQGLGFSLSLGTLSTAHVEKAVSQKWLGANYSDRIWNRKTELIEQLNTTFTQGVALGKNPRVIGREIAKKIDSSYNDAVRLARTEFNNVANQTTVDRYKAMPFITQYKFIATLDHRTSLICSELDGMVFNVEGENNWNYEIPGNPNGRSVETQSDRVIHIEAVGMEVGKNFPPMHPNCRSTTVAYFPPDEVDAMFDKAKRAARDPVTGEIHYVPADMTFKEWRETFTREDGTNTLDIARQKHLNRDTDKEQLKKYRIVFGDKFPKTIDSFQEMKYNRVDEWKQFKSTKQQTFNNLDYSPKMDGVFGNGEVRGWYNSHTKGIPESLDTSKPLEQQARMANDIRNTYKLNARKMMIDRAEADILNLDKPTLPFEHYYGLYSDTFKTKSEIYKAIIESSTRANSKVNERFGL